MIGLREGVEAALIVGIIAAFLVKEGRSDALRQMWLGVAVAISLCIAAAVALRIVGEELPQREQEALETVIGVLAVGARHLHDRLDAPPRPQHPQPRWREARRRR